MSSNLFQEYESQYCTVSTSVANALETIHTLSNDERKVAKVKQLERQLKDVEPTLQRLDMEARSSPGPESAVLVRKAKEYRKDWQKLMIDVKRASSDASNDQVANRSELGLLHDYQTTSQQQRDRLLSATEQLQQTGNTIREGRKQLLETEVRLLFHDMMYLGGVPCGDAHIGNGDVCFRRVATSATDSRALSAAS